MFTVKCWVLIVGGSLSTLFKLRSNLLDKLDKPYTVLVREHCSWLGASYTGSATEQLLLPCHIFLMLIEYWYFGRL